jgi:hypothetical protein
MRQGKERINGTEVQEDECESKKRKHERRERIRFARWAGKEKELSIGRKGNERVTSRRTSKERYLWEILERTEEGHVNTVQAERGG